MIEEKSEFDNDNLELIDNSVYFIPDYFNTELMRGILDVIEKYKLERFNIRDIEKSLENKEPRIFLSDEVYKVYMTTACEIKIDEDKMSASIVFYSSCFDGTLLTKEDILKFLIENNIKFGINIDSINELIKEIKYKEEYNIAKGTPPKESENGYIKYFINTEKKVPIPKILPDGSLDYKSLDIYEIVKKNDLLATKIKAVRGEYGKNIFGEEIPSEIPKDPPKFSFGKNAEIVEEDNLISTVDGSVSFQNGKISILDTLNVEKDVNNETGNINFNGKIIINGDVLTGFSVKAEGDIDIMGAVEGANVVSGGSIFISRGIKGGEKAVVVAKKDLIVQFIESATVIVEEGDIMASAIMHSQVECAGNLSLIGKKSLIVGGTTTVGKDINVKSIGLPMANVTKVKFGIEPNILNRYNKIIEESRLLYEKYKELEIVVNHLTKDDIKKLSNDKKELLLNSMKEKIETKNSLIKFKIEINDIIPLLTKRIGALNVLDKIYTGSEIFANNEVLVVRDEIGKCSIKNIDGIVKVIQS